MRPTGPDGRAATIRAMAATAAFRISRLPRLVGLAELGRRTLAEVAAGVQVALGTAVVLATADRRSFLSPVHHGAFSAWFAGPLRGLLPTLTRSPAVLHRDLRHVLLVMVGAWLIVVLGGRTVRPGVVIGAVVALHAVFLLSPPFALTDLFNYLGYARLDVVHHVNPYVQVPLHHRPDPAYAYSNWHGLLSPYGPLFTLLLLPTAKLPLPVAYWAYKVLLTGASLGLLAAVWACARRLGRPPAPAVAFVGLNPIVLVYALGGKHNELLMMACLLAGGLLILARREVVGGATLAAAVAIKASGGLLAPVIALGAPRRWRAVAGAVAGALVLAEASLIAFGAHLPDLRDQDRLVNPYSFPNLLGYATGHGGADAAVRRSMAIVLFAGLAACAAVAWRRRAWATPAGWAGLLGVVCVGWVMPWYVLWALPFAALSRSRALRAATVLMTAWLVLVYSGLFPHFAHQHGLQLNRTAVGAANHNFMATLLYDHPRPHELGPGGVHLHPHRHRHRHRHHAHHGHHRHGADRHRHRLGGPPRHTAARSFANPTRTSRQPRRTGAR
jgi:Glycosyltransferase family 87